MTVSVVIPCHNCEDYIEAAIESALSQAVAREVIVIDDGSTDNSWNQISRFGSSVISIRQENSGAPKARNMGIARASSKFIKFLDSDDFLHPRCLEAQMIFRNELRLPNNCIDFGDFSLLDEVSGRSTTNEWPISVGRPVDFEWLLFNQILISTPLYAREGLVSVGGFREDLSRGQEFDLNIRLFLHGFDFVYDSVDCFSYRDHWTGNRLSVSKVDRLSSAQAKMIEGWIDKMCLRHNSKRNSDNKFVAQYSWKVGRSLVQKGRPDLAHYFFKLAEKTSPGDCVFGGKSYRIAASIIGPVLAESLGALSSSFRKEV